MPLTTIQGTGSFDSAVAGQLNANFRAVSPTPDFWVRPQASGTVQDGSYANPFGSLALARPAMQAGVVIGIQGVLFEEFTTPLGVNDVTLLGMAGKPRQATTSGVPNGGGATWLTPAAGATSTTTPLLRVQGQGWTLQNLFFNSSATAAPCVQPYTTGDPPLLADGAHLTIRGCVLTGADDGVSGNGGTNFVTIDSCRFFGFSGTGDIAISNAVGAGIGTLYGWEIKNCEFWQNTRHIQASFSGASIHDNHFSYINGGVTTAIFYDATGGQDNAVFRNAFDVNSGNAGIAAMFVLGTNDRFSANSLSTAVTTTQFSWGDPA